VPKLTAAENVALPMEFAGRAEQERKLRARKLLDVGFLAVITQSSGVDVSPAESGCA
jgi:predicted ABC-type transport system involved in lysophospholipase L1 biosynthesis ATPase subunit